MEGKVRRLMDRGYGFIDDSDGVTYFFHRNDVENVNFDDLEVENLVSFDPEEGKKGKKATNIQKIEEEKEE